MCAQGKLLVKHGQVWSSYGQVKVKFGRPWSETFQDQARSSIGLVNQELTIGQVMVMFESDFWTPVPTTPCQFELDSPARTSIFASAAIL